MVTSDRLVSIAIRAWRRAFLGGAIASVLAQTWRNLELVVYDDAGDLEDIATKFRDERVRYVRAQEKLEASGRFRAAVSLCRGSYIGVLDDDDRYEPAFIERLSAVLDRDARAGIAFCNEVSERNGIRLGTRVLGSPGTQSDVLRKILTEAWVVAPSAMLVRRAALDAAEVVQPLPDGVAPDVFLSFRAALAGWEHVLLDETLVIRQLHDHRISRSLKGADYAVATFERLRIDDRELDRLRDPELARRFIARAVYNLIAGRRREAIADLHSAVRKDAGAYRWLRRAVSFAAHTPLLGPMSARAARLARAMIVHRHA